MEALEKIKEAIIELENKPSSYSEKVGIGITTHNRPEVFHKSYNEICRLAPSNAKIVVIDDASNIPVLEATYRFSKNVGIARAKNKALELLYLKGCEHIFLFDDDTYPLAKGWEKPYIECKELHLNYIFKDFATGRKLNDTVELYRDNEKVAYSHSRGCMMYYHRSVLEKVGGMDPVFGKWGFEHPSLSDRIYMAGLTTFRYMDVINSKGLFYSDDEQKENANTTVVGQERIQAINKNSILYNERKYSSEFLPFIEKKNILLTSYFTNVPDPQRGEKWDFDLSKLTPLINSLKETKLIVLHDNEDYILENTDKVEFVKVSTAINPYFQRWVSYKEYLFSNRHSISNVFCIDATDVEVLQEPDWDSLSNYLYTGDEPTQLDDDAGWMRKHHKHHLIQKLLDENGKSYQMLNAGILGGSIDTVLKFIRDLLDFYVHSEVDRFFKNQENAGIGDMGAFNYIARTNFNERIRHGGQVCTRFKSEERNGYSWFKHK